LHQGSSTFLTMILLQVLPIFYQQKTWALSVDSGPNNRLRRDIMTGFGDRLYEASPIWMQKILVATFGAWWYYRRFGGSYQQQVTQIRQRDDWTAEQWNTYQNRRLRRIIKAAVRSVYYPQLFQGAGIRPEEINLDTLHRLPYLEKDTLRQRSADLLTQAPPRGTVVLHSSGTTGTPTDIYYTPGFHTLELAFHEARCKNWAGVSYKDRRVMFGVRKVCRFEQNRPPFWRLSPIENMAYLSIYHLTPRYIPAYIDFLNRFQPKVVMGYPSSLGTLAQFALDSERELAPARAIITMAETLTTSTRKALEAAWHCRVWDLYGAVEQCMLATQCEYGSYHTSPDVGIIEIVNSQGTSCRPGEIGEVICTGLQNELQPLIRYRVGDIAAWSTQQTCACGRQMPILESIQGRYEDMCFTADGRAMLRFDTVFKGIKAIKEAQVIQEAIDQFVILVVPTAEFDAHDAKIIQKNMLAHVGNVRVDVQQVDAIPRARSGKFRAVISRLTAEDKDRLWRLNQSLQTEKS
jgi:phenylacetate-CoA ligase